MKKKKKVRKPDSEICYGHRVEFWIRASYFGIRGVNLLLHALMAQQTPDWAKQRQRTKKALAAFESAAHWIRIAHNVPLERPAPRKSTPQCIGETNETKDSR